MGVSSAMVHACEPRLAIARAPQVSAAGTDTGSVGGLFGAQALRKAALGKALSRKDGQAGRLRVFTGASWRSRWAGTAHAAGTPSDPGRARLWCSHGRVRDGVWCGAR